MKIETPDQFNRTLKAIEETSVLIASERAYLVKHQNDGYLTWLENHSARLSRMIDEYLQRPGKAV